MGEALSFVSDLWDFICSLLPHLHVIPATHKGVKFVHGKKVVEVGPGLIWYWPIVTELEIVPVVRQIARLPTQTLTTEDDVPVVVGGLVIYSITNPTQFLAENWNADSSTHDVCLSAIREVVCGATWANLRSTYRDVVDNRLTKNVESALGPYGVTVERAKLTDLAKTKVISLVHSNEIPNNSPEEEQ